MKTLILDQPGQLRITQTDEPPEPGPGQALVRVHQVGICGTDLHAFEGNQTFFSYPRILGHELAVEVVAAGENARGVAAGARCAVEPYLNCGDCSACRRGKPNCCKRLEVLGVHIDGGMREQMLVPVSKLHPSEKLTFSQLALVEPLSVAAHAVGRARLEPDEWVLVIGAGPIGLGVIQFARASHARVAVLEISATRLRQCRSAGLAELTLDAGQDPLSDLRAALDGDLPAAVFDCTGNPQSMMKAFELVDHGGRLMLVGHFPGDVTFHDPLFHGREMTLLATRNATGRDFSCVIGMLEKGEVQIDSWISHPVSPESVPDNFPRWLKEDRDVIKPLIQW